MRFSLESRVLWVAVALCLLAGGDVLAQAQEPAPALPEPEQAAPKPAKKARKRPVKPPSKELQSELAKEKKRQTGAPVKESVPTPAAVVAPQPAQQRGQKASGTPANNTRSGVERDPGAGTGAQVAATPEKPDLDKPVATSAMVTASPKKKRRKRVVEVKSDILVGIAAAGNTRPGHAVQFGKFNGLTDNRVFVVGAANLQSQGGRRYWNLKVDNIALDNRSMSFDGGTMGKYKIHFGYSELDSLLSSTSQTPFTGAGSSLLTLPAGFTRAPNTSGMTDLAASLQNVELGTTRKEGDVNFSFQPGKNTTLAFAFRRYFKSGVKSLGAALLNETGSQGLVLPEPVDYHTDEFRTGFDWRGERSQANVEYYFSRFTNHNRSLTWDNPFTDPSGQPPYPDTGRTSLPPDNLHHRLSLGGSITLAPATSVSALFEKGSMTQNEAFLPYTINSLSTIPVSLPRSSADARIDTTLFKLDLAARPLSPLSLHAGYQHYKTDNKTPRDLYLRVVNDTGDQVLLADIEAKYSQPYASTRDQLKLDGSWYFGKGSTLKVGWDRDQKAYALRAVDKTIENSVSARLNKRWEAGATAYLDLGKGRRRAGGYNATKVLENVHTSQYLATLGAGEYFDSLPGMRQFDIADRDTRRLGLGTILLPMPDLTVGLNANHLGEDYNASQFGLQERKINSATLDATLTPDELSSWSIYYTRQESGWQQASRAYSWNSKAAGAADPANDWWARNRDTIDTVGVNIALSFLEERLPVRFSYTYSNIRTDIRLTAASGTTPAPVDMPRLKGRRQTVDLSGTYGLSDTLSVRVGTMLEFYRCRDWATDNLPPGTSDVPEVLTLSGSARPYRAYLLTTALNYRF